VADKMNADLGAVAMREHDSMPLANEADDGVHASAGILELMGDAAFAAFFYNSVAAKATTMVFLLIAFAPSERKIL